MTAILYLKYSLMQEMYISLITYVQIIILSKKGLVVHILLKRTCDILYFVTYDLPITPSNLNYGISKFKFKAKKPHFYEMPELH